MSFRLPAPVLVGLIALAVATLIGLGVWQLQRNAWRQELVAERNAAIAGAPLPAAEVQRLPLEEVDYRRVAARGNWDYEHTMVIANRARFATKGEDLVVPLLLAPGGPAVLVNRGWYQAGERDRVLAELRGREAADIEGLGRYVEGLEARRTPAGTWTQLSPSDMGATLPYPVLPWFVIEGDLIAPDASRPNTLLAQGFYPYTSTTPHLEYALTWFGLAAALVAVAVVRFLVAPRRARAAARHTAEGGTPAPREP